MTLLDTETKRQIPAAHAPDLFQFRTPAVRHLAWLTQAPQLISTANTFDVASYLPHHYLSTLQTWDTEPDARPDILHAAPHYRLGHYMESLYHCLLQDLMGWTVLARNLPIREHGLTLGELDFVVRNPHSGNTEHHEIAIKFYLGYRGSDARSAGWYGPNPRDRLDTKTTRLLEQQCQRVQLPATAAALAQRGIDLPDTCRVFMPGYLFYQNLPANESTTPVNVVGRPPVLMPDTVPADHLRGHWMYVDDVTESLAAAWVLLEKPDWLGPWVQSTAPDSGSAMDALAAIRVTRSPRLFAVMAQDKTDGEWRERDRLFVVPPQWPGQD